MSDLTQATAQTVADLRARFILHERFEPLQARFRLLLEKRLADIAAGRSADAHGIALSGASGTGKSCAVAQLIARAKAELAHSSCPDATIISLRVPSPATLKFLGQMILRALGYNLSAELAGLVHLGSGPASAASAPGALSASGRGAGS